jgi:hypothetical protein
MKWPKTMMVDPGTEFKGELTKVLNKREILIQRGEAGNHKAQSLVERANRTIAEKLFSHQYAQEMLMEETERSREWVMRLPMVIQSINTAVKRITGKKPMEAIEMKKLKPEKVEYKRPIGLKEERLPGGVKVRYLYAPGEEEGGEKRRATDPIWSLNMYDISRTVVSANQPVLYFLTDGARRSFVREELQAVPEDTQLPPESVLT